MRKPSLIALAVGITLATVGAYFMLTKAPAEELPSENVPSGVVTKASTLEQDETWSDAPEEINKFDVLGHANL